MQRRTLFKWIVGILGVGMSGIIAVPAVICALSPATRRRAEAWRAIGPVQKFPLGQVVQATVSSPPEEHPVQVVAAQAVYVWHRSAREFVVFSRTCTDLGCAVTYDPGSEFYYCPCHGGIFNKSGERVAGPPEKPLYRYATRVRDGALEIDLRSVPVVA
jgi:menaquinol-cytochrome c reductase iron-sulfur subunit